MQIKFDCARLVCSRSYSIVDCTGDTSTSNNIQLVESYLMIYRLVPVRVIGKMLRISILNLFPRSTRKQHTTSSSVILLPIWFVPEPRSRVKYSNVFPNDAGWD